jgi:hypothetical protein
MHEQHVAFTQGLMIGVIICFCGGFLGRWKSSKPESSCNTLNNSSSHESDAVEICPGRDRSHGRSLKVGTGVATAHTFPRKPGDPMRAVCSICRREDRTAIEQAHVVGVSLRAIAKLHSGTTAWSLRRHFQHVPLLIDSSSHRAAAEAEGAPVGE